MTPCLPFLGYARRLRHLSVVEMLADEPVGSVREYVPSKAMWNCNIH